MAALQRVVAGALRDGAIRGLGEERVDAQFHERRYRRAARSGAHRHRAHERTSCRHATNEVDPLEDADRVAEIRQAAPCRGSPGARRRCRTPARRRAGPDRPLPAARSVTTVPCAPLPERIRVGRVVLERRVRIRRSQRRVDGARAVDPPVSVRVALPPRGACAGPRGRAGASRRSRGGTTRRRHRGPSRARPSRRRAPSRARRPGAWRRCGRLGDTGRAPRSRGVRAQQARRLEARHARRVADAWHVAPREAARRNRAEARDHGDASRGAVRTTVSRSG